MTIKRIFVITLAGVFLSVFLANWSYNCHTKETGAVVTEVVAQKICYLTFDDGPSHNTEKVLDILKKYNIKATFFLIGSEIGKEDAGVLARMQEEGHGIGLHSNVHDFDKIYAGIDNCVKDYKEEQRLLYEEYGIDTKLFRFPGGSACTYMNGQRDAYIDAMRENGFICFDWHVSGEDSVGNPTVYSIQKNVSDTVFRYERPIILLHDSGVADVTVDALPGIIESMRAEGYTFATLNEREGYIFRR